MTEDKETPHRIDFVFDDVRNNATHDNGPVVEKFIVQLIWRRLYWAGIIPCAQFFGGFHECALPVVGIDSYATVYSDMISGVKRYIVCGAYIAVAGIVIDGKRPDGVYCMCNCASD